MQQMSTTPTSLTTVFLRDAIQNSPKTQREIAQAAGFAHPNALSMMKTGETKVPISRIPALAAALDVDTKRFLQIAMREYHPEIWMTLDEFMSSNLSPMEEDILETYHLALVDYDIPWTDELKRALTAVFELAADKSEEI
jgi:transcriptional regulator with XRE-family HTH domain